MLLNLLLLNPSLFRDATHWIVVHPLMRQLYYYTIHACAMLHETLSCYIFSALWFNNSLHAKGQNGTVFCIFSALWLTYSLRANGQNSVKIVQYFSAIFLHFDSLVNGQNGAAWKSNTGPWLQSREGCHDFTIPVHGLDSLS